MDLERLQRIEEFDRRVRPIWVILIIIGIIIYFATDGFKEGGVIVAGVFLGIPFTILMIAREVAIAAPFKKK